MLLNTIESSQAFPAALTGLLPAIPEVDTPEIVRLSAPVRGGLPPRALRRVREYIEDNLEESVSIKSLAEIVGLSMFHFARAFKQSVGLTPHDYVVQCRVRRAKELLSGTDMPMSQVALAAGFSDQSHCARRFREHVGVTPSAYRWSAR